MHILSEIFVGVSILKGQESHLFLFQQKEWQSAYPFGDICRRGHS